MKVPNSPEAEKGVLACVFLDTNSMSELTDITEEAFHDLRNRTVYKTMTDMWNTEKPITIETVADALTSKGKDVAVGYLVELTDATPSAANLPYWRGILQDKFQLRSMVNMASILNKKALANNADAAEVVNFAETHIKSIMGDTLCQKSIKDDVKEVLAYYEACYEAKGRPSGISTGYPDLDNLTQGLGKGNMVVIAARPSVGKTSLAMNIVERVCVEGGVPTAVFSLEMSRRELCQRLINSMGRIDARNAGRGILTQDDVQSIHTNSLKISKAPLYIDDTAGVGILKLRSKARQMKRRHDIQLVVVDYLQLLKSVTGRNESRTAEVTDISNGIKQMAKELEVPVLCLAQLNRDIEKSDRRPVLSDLRDSGAIEQDADIVMFLHWPNKSQDVEEDLSMVPQDLIVAKHRNGPTGLVHLMFNRKFTRYESAQ